MKKLIGIAFLLVLPYLSSFALDADGPRTKSVSTQIRVIIPPFAVIRLAGNTLRALPLNEVPGHLKQADRSLATAVQSIQPPEILHSNQEFIRGTDSKTERTPGNLQIINTYTTTQQ